MTEDKEELTMDGIKVLEMKGMEKSFAGVKVLKNINLDLVKGEVLGIVGENGAGKSTLMNILGGVHLRDSGSMIVGGEEYSPVGPKSATERGIAFIHQELNLFSNLSVAENMFINDFPKKKLGGIDFKKIVNTVKQDLINYGLDIDPNVKVEELPMGTRQVVEIIKALRKNAKILILDEPTTSLSTPEKEKLFETVDKLKNQGISVLFISHILEDVFALCDRITVIRDGNGIGTVVAKTTTQEELIQMMVGRELNKVYPETVKDISDESVLDVHNIISGDVLKDVSLSIKKGEILGMYGIIGAGRTELAKAVFGVDPIDSGRVIVNGKELKKLSPEECINEGIAFVTEDRRLEGLLMPKSVAENITIIKLKDILGKFGVVNQKKRRSFAKDMSEKLNIKVHDIHNQDVNHLSGGNQQKVVFGKWVLNNPEVFILDEPTRGVDVGAKFEIYSIIGQMAKEGSGILLISSEMEELIGTCDRILVMKKGQISGEVVKENFSQATIGSLAL